MKFHHTPCTQILNILNLPYTLSYEDLTLQEFTEMIRTDPANFFDSPEGVDWLQISSIIFVNPEILTLRAATSVPRHHRGPDRWQVARDFPQQAKNSAGDRASENSKSINHFHQLS